MIFFFNFWKIGPKFVEFSQGFSNVNPGKGNGSWLVFDTKSNLIYRRFIEISKKFNILCKSWCTGKGGLRAVAGHRVTRGAVWCTLALKYCKCKYSSHFFVILTIGPKTPLKQLKITQQFPNGKKWSKFPKEGEGVRCLGEFPEPQGSQIFPYFLFEGVPNNTLLFTESKDLTLRGSTIVLPLDHSCHHLKWKSKLKTISRICHKQDSPLVK